MTDQDQDEVKTGTAKPGIREAKLSEQFSANGQAVLRKHFSSSAPTELPKATALSHSVNLKYTPSSRPYQTRP